MARSPTAQAAIDSRDREAASRDDGLPGRPAGGRSDNKPTHFLSAFDSTTGLKGRVGSAWLKPDGSISIALNSFVSIPAGTGLTLWPRNERDDQYGR